MGLAGGAISRYPRAVSGEHATSQPPPDAATAADLLGRWPFPLAATVVPVDSGLINRSFTVAVGGRPVAVLQWLNPLVVPAEVNRDIATVSRCLTAAGVATPLLLPTRTGELWAGDDDGGVWRCLSYVGERTVERRPSPAEAASAGALVARFHRALSQLDEPLVCPRRGAQDSERHFATPPPPLADPPAPRRRAAAARLRDEAVAAWQSWRGPRDLPRRLIHGDLKISNVRFAGTEAVALVDLDTLAMATVDAELGDALRSWCNAAGEDERAARFDLAVFTAAIAGYADGGGRALLTTDEWSAIVPGIERIALNLTARFAADAVNERYFGWSPGYGGRGEHCLLRARGQASLAATVRARRGELEAVVARVVTPPGGRAAAAIEPGP